MQICQLPPLSAVKQISRFVKREKKDEAMSTTA